jgi:hypothetical protein
MSTPDRLLGIFLTLLFVAYGFCWGYVTRAIQEKDKKGGEE